MSLASTTPSRTHFEVLGLNGQILGPGLEASKSLKMHYPWPRTALFFDLLKMGLGHDLFFFVRNFTKNL